MASACCRSHCHACAGTRRLNRKTVSFVMSDPNAQKSMIESLKQPAPPAQPRTGRGFIRSHLPHLRLSSSDGRKLRRASAGQTPSEVEGFALTQQGSDTLSDDDVGDSLSAVLLANAQPLSQRSGSLDRPPSLQRSSLQPSLSVTSKPLLDNANPVQSGELIGLSCHYHTRQISSKHELLPLIDHAGVQTMMASHCWKWITWRSRSCCQ